MTIDHTTRIDPAAPAPTTDTKVAANQAEDSASFRRMLESLERLAAKHKKGLPAFDAESVDDAVARADEGFSLAMDLRRQLEDAFRRHMP